LLSLLFPLLPSLYLALASLLFIPDPYTLSSRLRSSFRAEKAVLKAKSRADDNLLSKFALPSSLKLLTPLPAEDAEWREDWERARGEREKRLVELGKGKGSERAIVRGGERGGSGGGVERLRKTVVGNTKKRFDPFAVGKGSIPSPKKVRKPSATGGVLVDGVGGVVLKARAIGVGGQGRKAEAVSDGKGKRGGLLTGLDGYGSDD
jgi:hypothetical protein